MSDIIFDDKTFQDLTKDIYNNASDKKNQIHTFIEKQLLMHTGQ